MSIREGIRTYLSDQLILRTCMYLAAALGVALLVVWPRGSLEAALRSGAGTDSFTVVAICFLVCMLFLEARFGAQDFSADPAVHLQEHVRLTPVPLARLVGGRAGFAFLHTLLLLLLGAPFLAAAMAVGGAGLPHLFRSLAVIGAAGMAARSWGLLSLCVLGTRRPLREMMLYPVLVTMLIVTFLAAPSASPFHALNEVLNITGGFPGWLLCTAASLGAAVAFCGFSILALAVVRVRARERENG